MSGIYAGAVLFNDWYASMHILNSIRAATGSYSVANVYKAAWRGGDVVPWTACYTC